MSGRLKITGAMQLTGERSYRILREMGYEAVSVIGSFTLANGEVDKRINLNVNTGEPVAVTISAGDLPVTVKINSASAFPFVIPAGQTIILDQLALTWLPDIINVLYLSNPGAASAECRIIIAKNLSIAPFIGFENFETLTLGNLSGTGHYGTTLYLTDLLGSPVFANFQVFDAVAISEAAYQGGQLGGGDAGGYAMPDGSIDPNDSGRGVGGTFNRTVHIQNTEWECGAHFKAPTTPAELANGYMLMPFGGAGGPPLLVLAIYAPFTIPGLVTATGTSISVLDFTGGGAPVLVYEELLDAGNILCDGDWREFYFHYWMDGSRVDVHLGAIVREIYTGSVTPPTNPIPEWPEDGGIQHVTSAIIGSFLWTDRVAYTVAPDPYYILFDRFRLEPYGAAPPLGYESFEDWMPPSPVVGAGYYADFINPALKTPPGGLVYHSPVVIDTDQDSGDNSAFCEHSDITPDTDFHIYYCAMTDPFTDTGNGGRGAQLDGDIITQEVAFRFPDPTYLTADMEPVIIALVDNTGLDGTTGLPINAPLRRMIISQSGGSLYVVLEGQHTSSPGDSVAIGQTVLPAAFEDGNWHKVKCNWDRDGSFARVILDAGEASETILDVDLSGVANVGAFLTENIGAVYIASSSTPAIGDIPPIVKWDSYKQRSFGPETFEQFTTGIHIGADPLEGEDDYAQYGDFYRFLGPFTRVNEVEIINTDNHTAGGSKCAEYDMASIVIAAAPGGIINFITCLLDTEQVVMDRDNAKLSGWFKRPPSTFAAVDIDWFLTLSLGVFISTSYIAHYQAQVYYNPGVDETRLLILDRAGSAVVNVKLADGQLINTGAWQYIELTYDYAGTLWNLKIDAVDYNYDAAGWLVTQPDIPDRFFFNAGVGNGTVSPVTAPATCYNRFDDIRVGSFD